MQSNKSCKNNNHSAIINTSDYARRRADTTPITGVVPALLTLYQKTKEKSKKGLTNRIKDCIVFLSNQYENRENNNSIIKYQIRR